MIEHDQNWRRKWNAKQRALKAQRELEVKRAIIQGVGYLFVGMLFVACLHPIAYLIVELGKVIHPEWRLK